MTTTSDKRSESRNGVSIPWPTAWIEEAIAIIKDSGSQTPHTERKRQKRINALLSAVPCPPTDLGFNSPADRLAQRLQAAVSERGTPVGWIQELADGRKVFYEGDLDPREVHDNGKPCYRVFK